MELFYSGNILPGTKTQPGIQCLIDPGGLRAESNVVVPTLAPSVRL